MSTHTERLQLYAEITQCSRRCFGVVNDHQAGVIPRSFYWEPSTRDVTLLVVSKNPANAPDWEREVYRRTAPKDLASVHLQFAADVFNGTQSVPSSYHINLIRRVAVVLGVDAAASSVFRHAAMTALAKCQSVGDKTARVPGQTYSTCADAYLLREIALYRPVYLLALGNEPFEFLTNPRMSRLHGLKVGKLWHPSWSNMRGGEATYFERDLPALHREYVEALNEAGRGRSSTIEPSFPVVKSE